MRWGAGGGLHMGGMGRDGSGDGGAAQSLWSHTAAAGPVAHPLLNCRKVPGLPASSGRRHPGHAGLPDELSPLPLPAGRERPLEALAQVPVLPLRAKPPPPPLLRLCGEPIRGRPESCSPAAAEAPQAGSRAQRKLRLRSLAARIPFGVSRVPATCVEGVQPGPWPGPARTPRTAGQRAARPRMHPRALSAADAPL
jgi:hypothetical protein